MCTFKKQNAPLKWLLVDTMMQWRNVVVYLTCQKLQICFPWERIKIFQKLHEKNIHLCAQNLKSTPIEVSILLFVHDVASHNRRVIREDLEEE